jgi:hypothetical protein
MQGRRLRRATSACHMRRLGAVSRGQSDGVATLKMVGPVRFELTTPCTPCKCATRLRYGPDREGAANSPPRAFASEEFAWHDARQESGDPCSTESLARALGSSDEFLISAARWRAGSAGFQPAEQPALRSRTGFPVRHDESLEPGERQPVIYGSELRLEAAATKQARCLRYVGKCSLHRRAAAIPCLV